ncbi:AEC family transporter [Oceanisphaera psychrotolerans]|uniref:Transporter n=1 Tax=Oceanisphaera psychrotolerans TaxID=1414654 RepID=A0A1J4QHS6_9GAMM|nr:AEC family transporter [Oceanisphaera psychrotolerans]OIN14006.1 transporter [Oceanisphaera psychrotolerans]
MLSTLLNIVVPVFAVVAVGFAFGRRQHNADMGFVNQANVAVFCPALVFSALIDNPVRLGTSWPLMLAGVLVILLPGLLLCLFRFQGLERRTLVLGGMFRNTGNIGIPLMLLAYGEDQLGAIIILFVLSNLVHFSLGLFILSREAGRGQWLKNPIIWSALLGMLLADHPALLPEFVYTSASLLGQIAVPLMLFALGVRLSCGEMGDLGLALRVNLAYLLVGAASLLLVAWWLPLGADWLRLLALSVMLPPAVLNYLLCEQYRCQPDKMASIVLLGNGISVLTIPLVIYLSLTYL